MIARLVLAAVLLPAAALPAHAQEPRLFYEQDGAGTTVVLIEGWAHDTSSWFLLLPALRERHRLLRYDLRGQGRSEAPEDGDYSPAAHRRDLERVLDGVGAGSAHLVGAGVGARIALEAALAHPERVRSLVLIQPRLGFTEEERRWWNRLIEAWEGIGRPSLGEYSSVLVQRWVGSAYATHHPWVPPFHDLMLRRQMAGPLIDSLRAWLAAAPPEGVVAPGVPILVVVGREGSPPGGSLEEAAPRAARLRLPDSRWPTIDAADELRGSLLEFLETADDRSNPNRGEDR